MLFFCVIVLVSGSVQSTVPWKYLPENMEPFCPSKNICDRNISVDFPRRSIPAHFLQCCSDCSCEANCGLDTGDCCFLEMDRRPKLDRSLQECIYPTSITRHLYRFTAFFMNSRSTNTGGYTTPDTTDTTSNTKHGSTSATTPDITDKTGTSTHDITDISGTKTPGNTGNSGTTTPDNTDNSGSTTPDNTDNTDTSPLDITDTTDTTTPSITDDTSAEVPCGEVNVTNFGTMYPVYSLETKKIYKNPVCAHEDGMHALILWNMYLKCDNYDVNTNRHFSLSQFQLQHVAATNCDVMFMPPDEIVDLIQRDICYNDVIDTCNKEMVYEGGMLTHEEVVNACESGFFSPFIIQAVYANVFCYMCNKGKFRVGKNACDESTLDNFLKSSRKLSTLLTTVNAEVDNPWLDSAKNNRQRIACFGDAQVNTNCRPIHCSSGRSFDKNGGCEFTFLTLFGMTPKIALFLHPSKHIELSELQEVCANKSAPEEWLKSPWPAGWSIITVAFRDSDGAGTSVTEQSTTIVIEVIFAKKTSVVPQNLLDEITNALRHPVDICTLSRCVKAQQTVSPYAEFTVANSQYVPVWHVKVSNVEGMYPVERNENTVFDIIYRDGFIDNWLNLGKTFLCEEIELFEDEFELLAEYRLLYYRRLNLILYENEFDLILKQPGTYTARVCMDVAGFTEAKETKNRAPGLRYSNSISAVSVLLTIMTYTVCI